MLDAAEIKGEHVLLRRPVEDDIAARLKIGRHRDIVEAYGGAFDPDAPYSLQQAEEEIRCIQEQDNAWVIDIGRFIGHLRFHGIVLQDRRASIAIGIEDPTCLGKGYGTEAIRLALGHAFDNGLHRVNARVLARNARAIACYKKCGFVEEGREREAAFVGGAWQDDIIMGVLDREFRSG